MRVVLDTNCLLVSISRKSIYRPIFDAFLAGKFTLVLSTDILLEYEEIIERKAIATVAKNIREILINKRNVIWQEVFFQFNLITQDDDDNKFVDVFVASNADYLVTNDSHFNHLKNIPFPNINIISVSDFMSRLSNLA